MELVWGASEGPETRQGVEKGGWLLVGNQILGEGWVGSPPLCSQPGECGVRSQWSLWALLGHMS